MFRQDGRSARSQDMQINCCSCRRPYLLPKVAQISLRVCKRYCQSLPAGTNSNIACSLPVLEGQRCTIYRRFGHLERPVEGSSASSISSTTDLAEAACSGPPTLRSPSSHLPCMRTENLFDHQSRVLTPHPHVVTSGPPLRQPTILSLSLQLLSTSSSLLQTPKTTISASFTSMGTSQLQAITMILPILAFPTDTSHHGHTMMPCHTHVIRRAEGCAHQGNQPSPLPTFLPAALLLTHLPTTYIANSLPSRRNA
jgi:hypothetical protein